MVVDQVKGVLFPSPSFVVSDHSMSDSGGSESNGDDGECSDSEMSEYDDPGKQNDSMTLEQYQFGLCKEALVRVESHNL